jgi:hypothetical protein
MLKMLAVRLGVAVLLSVLGLAAARADALTDLNDSFRATYAETRTGVLSRTAPVIVVAFESLVLIDGGTRRQEGFTPPLYHRLKAVAHLVFAVQLLLDERLTPGPLGAAQRTRLEELAARAAAADTALASFGFSPAQVERQRTLIAGARTMIAQALASGRPNVAALEAWLRPLVPLIVANVDDAAQAQLEGLHALVTRWRGELGPEAWARVDVVVLTVRQARVGNLQYAYFRRLLGPEAVGRRLIFAESVFNVDPAVTLLGTILTDRVAARAFFADELRMERDLLSDAAARIVEQLLPNQP